MIQYYFRNLFQLLTGSRFSWVLHILGIAVAIAAAMHIGLWINESILLKK